MQLAKQILLLTSIMSFVFSSCEKSIVYQTKEQKKKLVLYAFPMHDSTMQVHISKSTDILDNQAYNLINDCEILMYINQELVESLIYPTNAQWLNTNKIPKEGDSIQIICKTKDDSEFSGKTIVPEIIHIKEVSSDYETTSSNLSSEIINFSISFSDPKEQQNFYQLRVKLKEQNNNSLYESDIYFNKEDKVFFYQDNETDLLADIDYEGSFSDELINGLDYSLKISILKDKLTIADSISTAQLEFQLFSLSKEYYRHQRSSVAEDTYREALFYEPFNAYSNIKGGVGAIGGLAVSKADFKIK